ncbi:RNA dependent RNA polymerase-domain-containing protein [Hysterangium stoloniferum]|nr:RNA dependent RNA polymerase-domain-containing protein [Hysterangium stoloniferum]
MRNGVQETPSRSRSPSDGTMPVSREDSGVSFQAGESGLLRTDSSNSISRRSSQEYDSYWADLDPNEVEAVCMNAEANYSPVPISRETSNFSLGQHSRSENLDLDRDPPPAGRNHDVIVLAQPPANLINEIEELAWGVQWEIARLVNAKFIDYSKVIPCLPELRGSNTEKAPKVSQIFRNAIEEVPDETDADTNTEPMHIRGSSYHQHQVSPWPELDLEETRLTADPASGLGTSHNGWYAGRVHFIATLKVRGKGERGSPPAYHIALQRAELASSQRFARRFGSRRFIRVCLPKKILNAENNGLVEYFKKPFLLCGRIFRAFEAKDRHVFLIETNLLADGLQLASGLVPVSKGLMPPMGFVQFLDYHNPLGQPENNKQSMSKWAARFVLGLSTSVPGIEIPPENVHLIPDIVAPWSRPGKPPAELVMTDGCGFINLCALQMLRNLLKWERLPSAIQFRYAGAKGLLLLRPDYTYPDEPHIWLRPSQIKISYARDLHDASQRIIDVLRPSRLMHPARLSAETIVNIAENTTVPAGQDKHEGISRLLQDGLERALLPFLSWTQTRHLPSGDREAMFLLWLAVSRAGNVMPMRMAREYSELARGRGLISRWADVEPGNDDEDQPSDELVDDVISGDLLNLTSLEETTLRLLDAGFRPQHPFVNGKLKTIVKKVTDRYVDPLEILQPGEVFLKSSYPVFSGKDGLEVDILLGDVLVTRHPCKVKTDVRKVVAVDKPELHQYTDVILFSVKGNHSLASELGGGDYDGDTITVIPCEQLVGPFNNAELQPIKPSENHEDDFERSANESVEEFRRRAGSFSVGDRIKEVQNVLLASLRSASIVGMYSTWHDNAIYSLGYDHPETRRLAFMFTTSLDGAKTGLHVKNDVYGRDKCKWSRRGPLWKELPGEEPSTNENPMRRDEGELGRFILDVLRHLGVSLIEQVKVEWDRSAAPEKGQDEDLLQPYRDAQIHAKEALEQGHSLLSDELKALEEHVRSMHKKYTDGWVGAKSPQRQIRSPGTPGRTKSSNALTIRINGEVAREYERNSPRGILSMDDHLRERIQASYAYFLDTHRKVRHTSFALQIAFRALLDIKAQASAGGGVRVTQDFYNASDLQSGIRALSRQ